MNTSVKFKDDGIIFGLARSCAEIIKEISWNTSPERLIRLAVRQVANTGEPTRERVAAHLQTTLSALAATQASLSALCDSEHE